MSFYLKRLVIAFDHKGDASFRPTGRPTKSDGLHPGIFSCWLS